MFLNKFIILFCGIFFLFSSFTYAIDNSYNLKSKNNTSSPKINIISPINAQQYIISKPTIKATFNDSDGVNPDSVKIFVNYKNVTKHALINKNSISYKPDKKFKRGTQIVRIEVEDVLKNKSIKEWYFNVGTPNYNHYYGLIHSHTENSDGHGTYEDAYYTAKFHAKLDFFAVTDHSNMFDNIDKCNIKDGSLSSKWTNLMNVARDYNSPGKFLALTGFEMSYPFNIDNPIGHINILNTKGFVSSSDEHYQNNLKNFYDTISKEDYCIAQFNHPSDVFGRFNDFKYDANADEVISLFEVCNGYNKDLSKNKIAFDDYQKCLDLGWHVGPTANQDNHRTDWGLANEFRTVVLSPDLNENTFYDSLKNMRVYASQDKNIKIDYTINDEIMGSKIKNPTNLYFNISVIDKDYNDKIQSIEIISNKGKIVASKKFNSNLAKLELKINKVKESYYYVKVVQNNNKTSVTAPIWIEKDDGRN